MGVVVVIPGQETWAVNGRAFQLLRNAAARIRVPDRWVEETLERADALNGLHLNMMSGPDGRRVATALIEAAGILLDDLREASDPFSEGYAQALPALQTRLEHALETGW